MRVIPAVLPSLRHRISFRAPVVAGLVCVALMATGCASRGILGEKPAAAQKEGKEVVPDQGAQTTTVTPLQKFMWFFSPYRPDIQQGNFVSEEMVSQLKEGMTRDQVRFILGTPLLADIFHADRWDYPFRLARGSGETTSSRVVVYFDKEGKVARFEGGNLPTEKEYIDRIAGPSLFAKQAKAAAPTAVVPSPVAPSAVPSNPDNTPAMIPVTKPEVTPAATPVEPAPAPTK
ncbi:outer membrane protein assembly factor BamE domain-containing protein [Janthinobacterium sp. RB2R34]|uniref:outer membrane protein assembly factor BamE n=1 Tax=Janthinobacterium sp. RB2R34 TaxID=3424193 RepID=UPI003F223A71